MGREVANSQVDPTEKKQVTSPDFPDFMEDVYFGSMNHVLGGGFKYFFISNPTWGNDPI